MNKDVENNLPPEPTSNVVDNTLYRPHQVEVNVKLKKDDVSSLPVSPWWESKLTVAIVSGFLAATIPVTTAVLNHYENEAKKISGILELKLETERLQKNFILETSESVISKLTQTDLSYEAKLALYTFLYDVSEDDSGTKRFAQNMREQMNRVLAKKLSEENEVLAEKQDAEAKFSLGDVDDDNQNQKVSIAKQETTEAEKNVKFLQGLLVTYELVPKESNTVEKPIIRQWRDIEKSKSYSMRGKLGTKTSFDLYDGQPSTFGSFGNKIGVIKDGEVFTVEEKDVTFRGYKWLKVKLVKSEKIGWYSWENIRSELVLESE